MSFPQPRRPRNVRFMYRPQPLSQAVVGDRVCAAAVVVEMVKDGFVCLNGTVYDFFVVADPSLQDVNCMEKEMKMKVFHNDRLDWPEGGRPARGSVVILKAMMCKEYNDNREGTVYSVKMVSVCKRDADNNLRWYCHPQNIPRDIVNAEATALELFEWWDRVEADYPLDRNQPRCQIGEADSEGLFTLVCQVLKKTVYKIQANLKVVVLRVRDGSLTLHQFEEMSYTSEDGQHVFGASDSQEVDVFVSCETIPPELVQVKLQSFVQLSSVSCEVLSDVCRKLTLNLKDNGKVKLLPDDDPKAQQVVRMLPPKLANPSTRAEEGGANDNLDGCAGSPPATDEPARKRQRSRTPEAASHTSSPQKRVPSVSTTKPPVGSQHTQSPQPSTSRERLFPSPKPSSWQPFHLSPPSSPVMNRPQQPSSPQAPAHRHLDEACLSGLELWRKMKEKYQFGVNVHEIVPDLPQTHLAQHMKFSSTVVVEAKKTDLTTFLSEGRLGEVYCVEAVITDFRVATNTECHAGGSHLCLHQWVWGMCVVCGVDFSTRQLSYSNSESALNSSVLLHCQNCRHLLQEYNKGVRDEDRQPEEPSSAIGSIIPFIRVKVVLEDPETHFEAAAWLTQESAMQFFGVVPSFSWIVNKSPLQGVVEQLLAYNGSLSLGLKKQEVEGTVGIVDTVLHPTSYHSETTPHTTPDPQHPPDLSSDPQPSPDNTQLPQPAPTTPLQPQPSPSTRPLTSVTNTASTTPRRTSPVQSSPHSHSVCSSESWHSS